MKGKGRIFLKIISFCIIFALLALIGPQLLNAQKSKTKKLPTTKQPPPKGPRIIPFKIWGNVVKDGKAVPNVRIKLTRIQNLVSIKKRVVKPNEVRTDKNGRYSFSIDPKMEGQKYKLMPKHPNFPPGKWLWPQEKEFTLTKSMKIDFKFNPPPLKIKVFSTNKNWNQNNF